MWYNIGILKKNTYKADIKKITVLFKRVTDKLTKEKEAKGEKNNKR